MMRPCARADDLLDRARRAASIGNYPRARRATSSRRWRSASDARRRARRSRSPAPTSRPRPATRSPASSAACSVLARDDLTRSPRARRGSSSGCCGCAPASPTPAMEAFAQAVVAAARRHRRPRLRPAEPGQRPPPAPATGPGRRRLRGRPRRSSTCAGLRGATRAKAEHNLGYARLLRATSSARCQMIDEAAEVLSPPSAINRATVEQDRAEILTAAGRPREAIRALEQAAAGLRLAPAAHLPGRVRADPGLDAAARGPGEGAAWSPAAPPVGSAVRRARRGSCGADAAALVAEIAAGGEAALAAVRVGSVAAAPARQRARARRDRAPAPGGPGQRRPRRARRRAAAAAARCASTCPRPRHHPAAVARGAGRAGPCPRRRPARPRPRPRRARRPARLAVLVRQPRPAEHARRPRPRPGQAGARARPRARRSRPWSSSGPSAPEPSSGRVAARSARRPTSRWPAT